MSKVLHILITGGASGLGKHISEALIADGHRVWIWGRSKEVELPKGTAAYQSVDLGDMSSLKDHFESCIANAGHIDVLIHNASLREFNSVELFDDKEIANYINVNQQAPILLSRWAIEGMKSNQFGRIINITSGSGLKGYSSGSMYCSTKSAMIQFTEAAGRDLQAIPNTNITMNAIVPGAFSKTDGTKLDQYEQVVQTIIAKCKMFINGATSGETALVMKRKEKLQYLMGTVKKFLS